MPPFNYRFDGIFRPQVVAAALMIALVTALLSGIPTDVISNPWFTRMTPVSAADRALLVASSLLVGIALVPIKDSSIARQPSIRKLGIGGGIASWLAIGCAVCNKLIVALIGVSGALSFFGPLQPALGALSLVIGLFAVHLRFRTSADACPTAAG